MDFFSLITIAIALAMDAFAVSISSGIVITEDKSIKALKIALSTGFFQGFLTFVGWLGGTYIAYLIESIDHWIAFILLLIIGVKMIYEALQDHSEKEQDQSFKLSILLLLGIATSIDALAVGLSFAFLQTPILFPSFLIGITAFGFSILGVFIGKKVGQIFGNRVQIIGGCILILIGINILISHLFFA